MDDAQEENARQKHPLKRKEDWSPKMIAMAGLSPSETKILVAKAFAFQAFEAHRYELLRGSYFDESQYLAEFSSSNNLNKAKLNDEPLFDYLNWFHSVLLSSLLSKVPQLSTELGRFGTTLEHFISEQNLGSELKRLLDKIVASVSLYVPRQAAPAISLDWSSESMLTTCVAGRTVPDGPNSRKITLIFDLSTLDPVSFHSIPWILSHEFWCHCLADLGSVTKVGCDPTAAYEEGWMDSVQDGLIRSQSGSLFNASSLVRIIDFWEAYIVKRRTKASANVLWGSEVAEHFLGLLIQKLPDLDPISLFRQISVDLNALVLDQDVKGQVVDKIGHLLQINALHSVGDGAPLFGDVRSDGVAVTMRQWLADVVRHASVNGKCDVPQLIKLLKI